MTKNLNISNLLSLLRLLITIPLGYFLWNENKTAILVTAIIAALSDFLDGYFARKYNQETDLGKILDPIADKTIVAVSGLILLIKGTLPLWFGLLVIFRDIAILFAGLYIRRKYGILLTANMLGKITVNVIAISIISSIFLSWNYLTYVYLLATLFIIASLMSYLLNAIRKTGEVN